MVKPHQAVQLGNLILSSICSKYLNNGLSLFMISIVIDKLISFHMSLREDMYAQDSIDLLQNSGLQFREHEEHGIEPLEFAELLMSSGNENCHQDDQKFYGYGCW